MRAMRTAIGGLLFTMVVGLIGPAPARAVDAVLYEVTEAVRLGKGGSFKSSKATLAGMAAPGTVLCPTWITTQLQIDGCTITVNALGRADDTTGFGPVSGTFDVLMQDVNSVDMPEIVIMRGSISGTLDLSPAFVDKKPRGLITGEFQGTGVAGTPMAGQRARGRFDGTFRIPFRHNGKPSYLLDDESIVLVTPGEFILGNAMVRVELTFRDESLAGMNRHSDERRKGTDDRKDSKKDDRK
jgi:hypothetical protein